MATPDPSATRPRRVAPAAWLALVAVLLAAVGTPTAGAIVGGTPAEDGDHPWLAAVTYDDEPLCGGSVLAADLVLTAAHCTAFVPTAGLAVHTGSTRFADPQAQVRRVAEVRMHEGYRRHILAYDIALLVLDEPLELDAGTATIAVADPADQAELIAPGSAAVVAGWGVTSELGQDASPVLLETDQFILSDALCRARYAAELDEHDIDLVDEVVVCADHPDGHDSCYGDSGGPLVVHDPDEDVWYQLGVVSWGVDECGSATVYMEAPAYGEFLDSRGTIGRDPIPPPDVAWPE